MSNCVFGVVLSCVELCGSCGCIGTIVVILYAEKNEKVTVANTAHWCMV